MVIPCSRSARRPSVSRARSVYSSPRWRLDPLDRLELVLEDGLGVVEHPPDQGALPVVDRAGRGQAQKLHLEVPLPLAILHGGLAHPVVRPGGPRSVSREAATSMTISSAETAVDSTAPVQVMSPTVR